MADHSTGKNIVELHKSSKVVASVAALEAKQEGATHRQPRSPAVSINDSEGSDC